MDRIKVRSSNIESVGYEQPGTLHIEFHNGEVYEYRGVPEHYYRALSDAKSTGSAFHKYIKPNFRGEKI